MQVSLPEYDGIQTSLKIKKESKDGLKSFSEDFKFESPERGFGAGESKGFKFGASGSTLNLDDLNKRQDKRLKQIEDFDFDFEGAIARSKQY
jgi:hypothetical protein